MTYFVGVHGTPTEGAWLSSKLKEGDLVGTDPRLIPYSVWLNLESELVHFGITLVPLSMNFVDEVWVNRPNLEYKPIQSLDIKFAGNKILITFLTTSVTTFKLLRRIGS